MGHTRRRKDKINDEAMRLMDGDGYKTGKNLLGNMLGFMGFNWI